MRWISICFALGMLIGGGCAYASQGFTLLSGFASVHERQCEQVPGLGLNVRGPIETVEQCRQFQQANHGVGLRIDAGPWAGWAAGVYRNSIDRTSIYVAREFLSSGVALGPVSVHAGLLLGAATGYITPIAPLAAPELVMRAGQLEVALIAQLLRLENSPRFAALQLRCRF
jgi:hypothetical protein